MENVNTQIRDALIDRAVVLERVKTSLYNDTKQVYIDILNDIDTKISNYDELTIININKIIREIKDIFAPELTLKSDFLQLGLNEAKYTQNKFNTIVGIDLFKKLPTESVIKKIVNAPVFEGLTLKETFDKLDFNILYDMQSQIRLALLTGESIQQTKDRFYTLFNGKIDNNISTLVRTMTQTVVNQARAEFYKENEDIIKGYEHHSTLDLRTTAECGLRDGKQWDSEFKPIKGNNFVFKWSPLHYNCRSIILPITKSYRELGFDIDEIPEGTRASMDGQVPESTNFIDWIEKKSPEQQKQWFGAGKYELYKEGKITFSDLINQRGRPVTLKELENNFGEVSKQINVPKISFGYDGKFDKYVENIRDEAKIVIDKLPKPSKIKISDAPLYDVPSKTLYVDNNKATFLHEYGHHIDIGKGKKNRISNSDSFSKAISDDYKILSAKFGRKDTLSILADRWKGKDEFNGLSDIIDSVSYGKFREKYKVAGHGEGYYGTKGVKDLNTLKFRRESEAFANMFEAYANNGKAWAEAKELFPNLSKDFEEKIKGLINE